MFNALFDFVGDLWKEEQTNQRQDDMQNFNQQEAAINRSFNSAEAIAARTWAAEQAATQRDWTETMSSTAYQRSIKDLAAAGLNPILAMQHAGAPMGSGASASGAPTASGSAASSGVAGTPARSNAYSAAMQSASQIDVNEAVAERTRAERDKIIAEEQEVRERTPTHAVTRESMQQQIRESITRIDKLIQETKTSETTAANIAQQTVNLKAIIPQIEATIKNLHAQTKLAGAQTTLAGAQAGQAIAHTGEINQRVKENLPALEKALGELKRVQMQMEMPGRAQQESVQDSYIGSLGATLRALNPFNDFFRSAK